MKIYPIIRREDMAEKKKYTYIQVMMPLKIEWEPFYRVSLENIDINEIKIGVIVELTFARKKYNAVITAVNVEPNIDKRKIKSIKGINPDFAPLSSEDIRFWRILADYYMCSPGEVYAASFPAHQIALTETSKTLTETSKKNKDEINVPTLSEDQEIAYKEIKQIFKEKKPVLLNGVTGAGKTEIYIKLTLEALAKGKNVLYLVPEIALGRQLESRLREVFGDTLRVFNSSETKKQKAITAAITISKQYIVLGTRSSLLLPHRNLGLIVVDEEHDNSYKQDAPAPRYNGRDSAVILSNIHHCPIILGTATPSMESIYNCSAKKYGLVKLDSRFFGAANSKTEIIDTGAEWKKRGMIGNFSRKLISKIYQNMESGGQSMILRSRRAYSSSVQCQNCGSIPKCPHCDVSLTFHKAPTERLECHYCGYQVPYSEKCNLCEGTLKPIGSGTQKILEEAEILFPKAIIARLDSDISKKKTEEKRIIREFSKGKIDILIGTQMVAKGFDFENLSLVAVINADSFLGIQDFRADENAYRILKQFKGRCGRRNETGKFVIQTRLPDHPIYQALLNDEESFGNYYENLFNERKIFHYPPFTRMIKIIIKDKNKERLSQAANSLTNEIKNTFGLLEEYIPIIGQDGLPVEQNKNIPERSNDILIIGPYLPVIGKISDDYIMNIRLIIGKNKRLLLNKRKISNTIRIFEQKYSYFSHIYPDVDPI